ncbi:FAD-dependent oxidoreductase [Tengunoibacter tsumagoiensis]|uniref:Pyridine nucleotide-disulfide oxidoreductase n=1 Tax=Tengunoibacter tsumagoiensis TaxID=2014871 RepID=A0A401ZZY0_9CHLR|nr:FAD-dependent oxidoreductase [Tengunoibacter tsumagoiensis]GCE12379.1 pyridine nucleotide-disulfide oxidoreductase [Tengunoibacter tsumagoiensis]
MTTENFDTLIIGFGKGGKTLAGFLAKKGHKVAMVERSQEMYGGTCINIACIPTKSLVLSAEHAATHQPGTFEEKQMYYSNAINEKTRLVTALRKKNYDTLNTNPNVTVIDGLASFVSPSEVEVTLSKNQKSLHIQAGNIIIDTGTEPYMPQIQGLEQSQRIYTSTTLMEKQRLPHHMIVIGGGYVGLEFASIYRAFGSEITILEQRDTLLPAQDRDVAEAVMQTMQGQGIQFHFHANVQRIHDEAEQTIVEYTNESGQKQEIKGDAILVAVGRAAVTTELKLAEAGIATNERGFVKVDEHLRTNVPHIWALGDVNSGPQFTYISLDDFRIVRDQLYGDGKRSTLTRHHVPYSVFITPPLSHVGLSEEEAKRQNYEIKVAKLPAGANTRAQIMRETTGLLKAIVDAHTNKILGCTLYSAESNEVINTVAMAMHADMDYQILRDTIFTHPSVSEVLNDLFSLL